MVEAEAPVPDEEAPAPFDFTVDFERRVLIVVKRGYWDMATFERFEAAFREKLWRMRARKGCRYCLVDASAFAVQSADIAEALQKLVISFDPASPGRMAGVAGSQLGKLQAARHGSTETRRVFATRAEAEAWLFCDDD